MTAPIPPINARSSIEIKDSCDCSCPSSCWPRRKARHIKKAHAQTDVRVVDVSQRKLPQM